MGESYNNIEVRDVRLAQKVMLEEQLKELLGAHPKIISNMSQHELNEVGEKAATILRQQLPDLVETLVQHVKNDAGEKRALLLRNLPFEAKEPLRGHIHANPGKSPRDGTLGDLFLAGVRHLIAEETGYRPKPLVHADLGTGLKHTQIYHKDTADPTIENMYRYVCFAGHLGSDKTATDIVNLNTVVDALGEEKVALLMSREFKMKEGGSQTHRILNKIDGMYGLDPMAVFTLNDESHIKGMNLEGMNEQAQEALNALIDGIKNNRDRVGLTQGDFLLLDQQKLVHRGVQHERSAKRFVTVASFKGDGATLGA